MGFNLAFKGLILGKLLLVPLNRRIIGPLDAVEKRKRPCRESNSSCREGSLNTTLSLLFKRDTEELKKIKGKGI
jgi:hypothetical protein